MAAAAPAASVAAAGSTVVVLEPEPFAAPIVRPATTRDCQVVVDEARGSVRWVRCIVSAETRRAYCFVRTLRECIYGVVRHAVALEERDGLYRYLPDRQVAIKCMSKRLIAEQRRQGRNGIQEDPMNELAALQLLASPGHAHVQRLLECVEDGDTLYSICPFYPNGELYDFIENRRAGLPEDEARALFLQVVSGLQYIHSRRLCHRDLSLENILLDGSDGSVIIDLGMCLRVPEGGRGQRVLLKRQGQCGKLTYMSHEVFEDCDLDGFAVDMWSLGIVLFILLTGVPPLELPTLADPRFQMIATDRLGELMDVWDLRLSPDARNLLARLLQVEPTRRATIAEVLAHPWVVTGG